MIIRNLNEIVGTPQDIDTPNWNSRRILLAEDGMGFSFHDTVIRAGTSTKMWYRHHLESVYCIEGRGEIHDLGTDETHPIEAGTLYALNRHDRHILTGHTDMRMICVFNPPLTGNEVHDETGAYPIGQKSAN